ncbi:MAG: DUF1905 domain-containing protein [Polaromonas sp.]|uniref:YdeI/OmpD-associated family protein n=1 Tax=Polaromonas sp. TaxID=1869339 RepID=UPI0017AB733C|nr:YdeI/OmpD-associated family protein [Polaromonas sp.]MBA3594076.1 DUF1905 domain-containing protein [Polaromonas sp.]
MTKASTKSRFKAKLLRVDSAGKETAWAFLVLPKTASEKLPRRGRTSVEGTINGHPFRATLEPDGQLSHWLKVDKTLLEASGAVTGDMVTLELSSVAKEPEPDLPQDFRQALASTPDAKATWDATTTLARIDWVHWIESAKQAKTRQSRISDACDMLSSGKKRVCCFDPSGFYSKSLSAPCEADQVGAGAGRRD